MPCFSCICFSEGVDRNGGPLGSGRGYCSLRDAEYWRGHECSDYAPSWRAPNQNNWSGLAAGFASRGEKTKSYVDDEEDYAAEFDEYIDDDEYLDEEYLEDDEYCDEESDFSSDCGRVNYDAQHTPSRAESEQSTVGRKGMRFLGNFCLFICIVCFVAFFAVLAVGSGSDTGTYIKVFLGEGFFLLILGSMFRVLSKTSPGDTYVYLQVRQIKKRTFVVWSIIIAYTLFFCVIAIAGRLFA